MNNVINLFFNNDESAMKAGPKIYFRGVNRIHINRFKAYTHILSNRLNHLWQVTDNISEANAVATYLEQDNDKSVICLSLYDSAPNLNPPAIDYYELNFDEKSLIKQLNQAGRKFSLSNTPQVTDQTNLTKKIRVSGLPVKASETLCQKLNQLNTNNRLYFKHVVDAINDESTIFINHMVFVVEPNDPESVNAFYALEQLREQDDLTVDQLSVILIKNQNSEVCENLFDEIYDRCDESTQVILLDVTEDNDLKTFISYVE
ncbi:hypothetical protein [Marinicella litoralis]|uniref:Uncharacterized protein n=1 Tax=Marinicella litoralis TaxID=644220 RepID=A0A4R6XY19_9GAMM|nr:hypothetical protein [Marinicella litoralis]TDR22613.1 hypothetical protein C8D91_1105 [Marinicella litoralis]